MNLLDILKKQKNQSEQEWETEFEPEAREFLVLCHEGGGGSKFGGFWVASAYFLGYVDAASGEFCKGKGRMEWPVSDEEQKKGGCFGRFDKHTIYRVLARKRLRTAQQEGRIASARNTMRVMQILEKDARCAPLEELLAEYRKPVTLEDDVLGTLDLNKNYGLFEGDLEWCGEEISISMEVDVEDPKTWAEAQSAMRRMVRDQNRWDAKMRAFAAKALTELACSWRDSAEEPTPEITERSFAERIALTTLVMSPEGSFTAYFDDDDMFFGHSVTVYGSLDKGLDSAHMEG